MHLQLFSLHFLFLVTKEKAAPLIDEWTAKMALRALFTNTQVDSGLPTTSQMFDIQSTEADTTTVTDHTSTVANTKVVGSSEDTGCCSTNEVKNAINDNMPVSEVDLTPDKASHDLAVNNILQNCQSDSKFGNKMFVRMKNFIFLNVIFLFKFF